MNFKRKTFYEITDNKKMEIIEIDGIVIDNFRLMENQKFELAENITIVSGRNGTMKSTIMGLIAHPFRTQNKDVYGKTMETRFSDVFKLSLNKDTDKYLYNIRLVLAGDIKVMEPVPVSLRNNRHRLVPSGHEEGDGYFLLPSIYLNLKRLYPLVNMGNIKLLEIELTDEEKKVVAEIYERVFLKTEYSSFENFSGKTGSVQKNPIGPKDADYDIDSISSGEDNLGGLITTLISFQRVYNKNKEEGKDILTGILSIDEFEASLHPVAQVNLFEYLMTWSQKYRVQIVLNTHSLYLIDYALKKQNYIDNNRLILNFITNREQKEGKLVILKNPSYVLALEELTLEPANFTENLLKIRLLCEDEEAKKYINNILGRKYSNHFNIQTKVRKQEGTDYTSLLTLGKNYPSLLKETMSIVVVDADVSDSAIEKTKCDRIFRIPSLTELNLPLEKELVNYILGLESDNQFFKDNMSKEMFRQEFAKFRIPLNIDNIEGTSIKPFKNWFKSVGKIKTNKYRMYMVRNNPKKYDKFKNDLISIANTVFIENGMQTIK